MPQATASPTIPAAAVPPVSAGAAPRVEFVLLNVARGLAALMVVPIHVLIHLSGNDGWKGRYEIARGFAVPYFLVLTGFVLILTHRGEIMRGWQRSDMAYLRHRLHVFLVKRVVRLYPIYWLATTGVLVAALAIPGAMRSAKFAPRYLLQSYVAWPPDQTLPILPHGWTVPFIMKCYLIVALAYVIPWRTLRWVLLAMYAGVLVNTVRHLDANGLGLGHVHYLIDFVFTPWSLPFLWGALAAWTVQERGARKGSGTVLAIALAMLAGIYVADQLKVIAAYDVRMVTWGIVIGFLTWALAQFEVGRTVTVPRIFRLLGDASYSLYIIHLPLIVLLSRLLRRALGPDAALDSTPMVWLQVAICLAAAFAFHRFVEEPMSRYLMRRFLPAERVRHA